ncbi:MAG: hypothetical protein GY863_06880 [bacterium]|nr:hypothetical protein [bacterium]
MDTRQTMLVLGAIVIFSVTAFFTNREMLESGVTMTETQVISGASAIALSSIENIKIYRFDEELVIDPNIENPLKLTPAGILGPEAGETMQTFDDIDDFNDYADSVVTRLVTYYVNTTVTYVDTTDLAIPVGYRTYYKELIVSVNSPYMANTLIMKHVFSHWK